MKPGLPAFLSLLALTVTNPVFAARDTLRCGSKIVTIGMTMDEVLNFCGEPQAKETEEIPVRNRNQVIGSTETQIWTYRRSGGKPASLTFDQDRLVGIAYP